MAFQARVYRVLIASPSDVATERDIAVRVIQEWNDANSLDRQVAILPVRWETHTTPEYGSAPQEIINRQIVDDCDFVIGVFWTRIGTPTEKADSGTLEEIERAAAQKKPVLLYFSRAMQNPDDIDTDQLQRLRDFKKNIQSKALVEQFKDQVDFRDKLARQLDRQIRSLMGGQALGINNAQRPGADLQISFADAATGQNVGSALSLQSDLLQITDIDSIPEFEGSEPRRTPNLGLFNMMSSLSYNKNYYRQTVYHTQHQFAFRPIRFWLTNRGSLGARDVYVDLSFKSEFPFIVVPRTQILRRPDKTEHGWLTDNSDTSMIAEARNEWSAHFELKALQPQRVISPNPELAIAATESGRISIEARIYADLLSTPTRENLHIDVSVEKAAISAFKLLTAIGEKVEPPSAPEEPSSKGESAEP